MHTIESNKIILRTVQPEDAASVFEAVSESRETVGRWMSWATASYSIKDAESWIKMSSDGKLSGDCHEFGIFAQATQQFLGVVGLNQFNKVNNFCNLGYWVRASAQRQGYALAAVALARRFAFDELRVNRVEIVVADENLASAAVAEAAGAHYEGILRARLKVHGAAVNARMYSFVSAGA